MVECISRESATDGRASTNSFCCEVVLEDTTPLGVELHNVWVMLSETNRPAWGNDPRVRDEANPYCGNYNKASYQLLGEMRALGILTSEDTCRGMYSVYLGGELHWVDLRPIKLVLRGWHKIHQGICEGVDEEVSGSDIALILDTAREIAQRNDLRVYIHRRVGYPDETEEMELDQYLKVYAQAEVDIPIPDLITISRKPRFNRGGIELDMSFSLKSETTDFSQWRTS